MTAPTLEQNLSRSWTANAALEARATYKTVLGAVLIVDAAAGLAMLFTPLSVARLLLPGEPPVAGFVRVAGAFLLTIVALLLSGRSHPARAKLVNVIGLAGRALAAIAYLTSGGRMPLVGGLLLVEAAVLGLLYFNYFKAEVMSRP